jgi:hypothetical protein
MKCYNNPIATDEEIRNCPGDYYGCEICPYTETCFGMLLDSLNKIGKDNQDKEEDNKK